MRTPRIFILTLFLAATLFVFCRSAASVARSKPVVATTSPPPRTSRVSALFSFNSGFSLFTPNAAISLTDDNSTSFPAQPAAFGPKLPHKGLSGQLWIGSGFVDDYLEEGEGEGELGCSDIPGWTEDRRDRLLSVTEAGAQGSQDAGKVKRSVVAGADDGDEARVPTRSLDDGTDNHLHEVLSPRVDVRHGNAQSEPPHANMRFLQQSGEISGKVVLLSRGGCGFLEKVMWAQRRGATALIVGDNQKGGPLIQMFARGDTSNVSIPSVFAARTTAHLLSSLTQPGSFIVDTVDEDGRPAVSVQQPDNSGSPNGDESDASSSPEIAGTKRVASMQDYPSIKAGEGSFVEETRASSKTQPMTWWHRLFGRSRSTSSASTSVGFPSGEDTDSAQEDEQAEAETLVGDSNSLDQLANDTPEYSRSTKRSSQAQSLGSSDGRKRSASMANSQTLTAADLKAPIVKSKRNFIASILGGGSASSQGLNNEVPPAAFTSRRMPISGKQPPYGHDGLWVTITPSSSGNPFFDTLLVLVVSPLVTLTIVYSLLIVRARIRRRRWRAPKSVVEQLPVRTYHTVTASPLISPRLSPRVPSPSSPSPTTPLLQNSLDEQPAPVRPRPRSRTTTGLPETERLLSVDAAGSTRREHEKPSTSISSEWKKYMGRQVECVVCLEEYIDGVSQVMSLPCGHEFHAECITPWLTTRRRTCPICKGDVVRSLARGSTSSPRYEPYHDGSDDEEEAEPSGSGDRDEDVEQGILSPIPRRRPTRAEAWLGRLSTSLGAGSHSDESIQGDRNR